MTRIAVKSGDTVDAGTTFLEIDPLKQEATVHSQEANHRSRLAALESPAAPAAAAPVAPPGISSAPL